MFTSDFVCKTKDFIVASFQGFGEVWISWFSDLSISGEIAGVYPSISFATMF